MSMVILVFVEVPVSLEKLTATKIPWSLWSFLFCSELKGVWSHSLLKCYGWNASQISRGAYLEGLKNLWKASTDEKITA